jgi:hypothetical protein
MCPELVERGGRVNRDGRGVNAAVCRSTTRRVGPGPGTGGVEGGHAYRDRLRSMLEPAPDTAGNGAVAS